MIEYTEITIATYESFKARMIAHLGNVIHKVRSPKRTMAIAEFNQDETWAEIPLAWIARLEMDFAMK